MRGQIVGGTLASLRQSELDQFARRVIREIHDKHWELDDRLPPAYQQRVDALRAEYTRRGQQLALFDYDPASDTVTVLAGDTRSP